MRHRIKHHVNRPVLHMGLFTDGQMLPAAALVTFAAGWFYAGFGEVVARMVGAALILLPVAIMAVDNRAGGLVVERVVALARWYRQGGVLTPGAAKPHSYRLEIDEADALVLERERMARVDLESVFARDT
ncbi:MAG TPA: hypothetical protein VGV36_04725 [Solirubrobacteraceae bacterium]|nr:hypothetical protein [Solirubrobacteraceae bacterium]